jgi:voltage-gated potassium channel
MEARVVMAILNFGSFRRLAKPAEHGYTLFLVTLLALMVIGPIARHYGYGEISTVLLISLMLLAGLRPVTRRRQKLGVVVLLATAAMLVNWLIFATDWDWLSRVGREITCILFFGVVGAMMLRDILSRGGNVSWPLINGALSVYLLLGVVFSFVLSLLETWQPGSFLGADKFTGGDFSDFSYLSFVTLTTLGYGDITPANPVAGSVLTLEAVSGQIYLTVLVARLVGMNISAQAAPQRDPGLAVED